MCPVCQDSQSAQGLPQLMRTCMLVPAPDQTCQPLPLQIDKKQIYI